MSAPADTASLDVLACHLGRIRQEMRTANHRIALEPHLAPIVHAGYSLVFVDSAAEGARVRGPVDKRVPTPREPRGNEKEVWEW